MLLGWLKCLENMLKLKDTYRSFVLHLLFIQFLLFSSDLLFEMRQISSEPRDHEDLPNVGSSALHSLPKPYCFCPSLSCPLEVRGLTAKKSLIRVQKSRSILLLRWLLAACSEFVFSLPSNNYVTVHGGATKSEREAFKFALVKKECFNSCVYSLVFLHPSKLVINSDLPISFYFCY